MSGPGGLPLIERGRWARLLVGLISHAQTAWWGLVSARIGGTRGLVVVQAVILRDGPPREVLLSLRPDVLGWELPGGTVMRGEAEEPAVVREVREETGLEVEVVAHVGDWIRKGFRPHRARIYRCRVVGGRLRPSSETPRVGWFAAESPPDALFAWYHGPLSRALAAEVGAAPIEVIERWGLRSIWQAFRIDLRMRWQGLPPGADGERED